MNAPGDSNHSQSVVRHSEQLHTSAERPAASRSDGLLGSSVATNGSGAQLLNSAEQDGTHSSLAAQRSTPSLKNFDSPCLEQNHAHRRLQRSSEAGLPTPGARHLQVIQKPSTIAASQHAPNSVHSLSLFSASTAHSTANRSPTLASATQPSPKPPRPPRLLSASQLSPPAHSSKSHKPSTTPKVSTQATTAAEDIWDNFITSMSPPGPRAPEEQRGRGQRPVQSTPSAHTSYCHLSSPADSRSECVTRESSASSVAAARTPVQSPAGHRLSSHSPSLQPILETLDVDGAEAGSGAHNPLLNDAAAPVPSPAHTTTAPVSVAPDASAAPDTDTLIHTITGCDDGESELLAMLQGCMQGPNVPGTQAPGSVHGAASMQSLQHESQQAHEAVSAWHDGRTQGQLQISPGKRQRPSGGASASDTCNATISVLVDDPSSFSAFEEHGGVSVRALSEPPSLEPSFEPSCCGGSFEPSLDLDSTRECLDVTNTQEGEGGIGQLLALGMNEAMNPDAVDVNDRERSVHHAEQAATRSTVPHCGTPSSSGGANAQDPLLSSEHHRTASSVLLEDEGECEVGATLVQQAAQAAKDDMCQYWVVKPE